MDALLLYLLKASLCLVAFYISVAVILSRETFFRFSRNMILIGVLVCLLLPLIRIQVQEMSVMQAPFVELESKIISQTSIAMNHFDRSSVADSVVEPKVITQPTDWISIVFVVYIAGLLLNLLVLFRSVYGMIRIIRRGRKIICEGYVIVLVEKDISPFSWRKYIVISEADYRENAQEIIVHELAHIRHRHSLDIIYMESVLLFFWFNPAMWLLKHELASVHEYQADRFVLDTGINATRYQLLLVKKAVGASSYTLANSFNHSKIKKRITMMLKQKSNRWKRLRALMLLPMAMLSVYAFAQVETLNSDGVATDDKNTVFLSENETNRSEPVSSTYNSFVIGNRTKSSSKAKADEGDKSFSRQKNRDIIKAFFAKMGYNGKLYAGEAPTGDFYIGTIMYLPDPENDCTIYPVSYVKSKGDKPAESDELYWYVIGERKCHRDKFVELYSNAKVFFEKEKIGSEYTNVTEMYGITRKGIKTPAFYMAKP